MQSSRPTIYPSIMDTSFNRQHDITFNIPSNVSDVQALDNTSQTLPIVAPLATPPTQLNMNESQAVTPNYSLHPMQKYQQVVTHPQETANMRECLFFYTPRNDFQMYHIICKEISFNFESVSQLISNNDDNLMNNHVQPSDIFIFYHEQPEIKKIYQVTCEMVSHTFLFQFLNKIIYNIQFVNCEHQEQEFTKIHQENLKFHLKKDLIHYLTPKNIYEDNYNVHKRFIQDYRIYESMINSNAYMPNNFQQHDTNILSYDQSYTSQQDNKLVNSQNYGN
ncbi:hypothetical protein RclHR1_02890012 [Rhizophagus clarus]|uniref:Kinase-like domain-containing protein n=1 Tax=Rhizophagus clarus TaxID=94130 RepID=A0A2Z6R4K5_9GLOM|nr:hypothetical protein RclHR1_02890012 [Rhizophagus clarus]GES98037.1 kinase-like domain-containing protein [Rhizophagus clarus]